MIKKFHQNHFLQFASTEWIKKRIDNCFLTHNSQSKSWTHESCKFKKNSEENLIKRDIHENFVWIFNIKERYCNKTDFVNKYCVSVRHLILKHMILFHFHVMNWFFRTVQEIIKCYILNLILKLNNEYFIWIWLSNSIIKNALEFDYMFDSYHMQCIRIKVISLIDFLFCATSCILQKHHNLAFNKIIFFSLKFSQSLFIFSYYVASFFHYYYYYSSSIEVYAV